MKKNKLIIMLGALGIVATLGSFASKTYAVYFYDTLGTKCEGAVERLSEINVVEGTSSGIFSPAKKVTRAEFAKMLVMAALKPSEREALKFDDSQSKKFRDLDSKAWYYEYTNIAINNKFMSGYEDGTFQPNKEVSYSEIAKMVTRALGHTYLKETDPRGWDAEYIDKAWAENLFDHVSFEKTSDPANRGDVANIIWNMLKANEWEMIYRNDTTGFTYVDSGHTLISSKIIDHVALFNARVQDYKEINGEMWVQLNGNYYRLFDQKAKVYFSSIGGYSDVLLKRVEYPGKIVKLEVVGISTDVGAQLYSGTYKEFEKDNLELINKTKLSKQADYAFLYHYEDDPANDRTISINLSNTYLIDKVKVSDKTIKDDTKKEDKDTSHSKVDNQYLDDTVAYRYTTDPKNLTRTITINEDDAVFDTGAVVFKDNERVQWSSVKKGDVLVEITPEKYYFVQTGDAKTVILKGYSTEKDNYYIETSDGKYETYKSTLYTNYLNNTVKEFNNLKKTDLENIIGKKVSIIQDLSERVIKIELLEDEVVFEDLDLAFFISFHPQNNKTGVVRVLQNGVQKSLYTSSDTLKGQKGDLVKIEYEKGSTKSIKSLKIINGATKLTDKIKVEVIEMSKLASRLEYFDDEELDIYLVTNHYKFGQYDEIQDASIDKVSIEDIKGLPTDSKKLKCLAVVDSQGVIKMLVVTDDREVEGETYYGLIKKIYRNYKDKKTYVTILTTTSSNTKDYLINDVYDCEVGDFVNFEMKNKDSITFGEKYTTKSLGYKKDLIVESENLEKKKVVSYNLKDGGLLDLTDWSITTETESYKLRNYEVFLLDVSLNKGAWQIDKASRITQDKAAFKAGDRIAINEIEGTAIVYRGYSE